MESADQIQAISEIFNRTKTTPAYPRIINWLMTLFPPDDLKLIFFESGEDHFQLLPQEVLMVVFSFVCHFDLVKYVSKVSH